MALGCFAWLAIAAGITYIVDQTTSAYLPAELRHAIAACAGVLLTLGLSNVWTLLRGYGRGYRSRAAVLERARIGMAPERDGPIVVTGTVRANAGVLRAPISGSECVAYQYKFYVRQLWRGRRQRDVPIYWGYACRPFHLDSASRVYHVMALPQLADAAVPHDSDESRRRAKAYVEATQFEPKHALMGVASSAVTLFSELRSEPSGETRRDWRAAGINRDIDTLRLEENVVPVNATVSIAGHWSAERAAIVPASSGEGLIGVTLALGPAENLARAASSPLPWSALSVAITAVILLSLGALLVWLATTGQIANWWRLWSQ